MSSQSPRDQSQMNGGLTHSTRSGVKWQHDTAFVVDESKRRYDTFCEPTLDEQEQVSPANQIISSNSEQQLKRARLTRKNLALFNKIARKKPASEASASATPDSESSITKTALTTKTTSTTMSGFMMQAQENGILAPELSKPPTNLEDLRAQLSRSRETPSPPESLYESYVGNVSGAVNEATVVCEASPDLLKRSSGNGYSKAFNQAFTGFPQDVGFNNGLSAPQPDFIEGLTINQYYPFSVHKYVKGATLYKDNPRSLALPHLAGEWKAFDGNMAVAKIQSSYDGAALVYARNQALAFIGKPDPPGHAQVTTFATDGSILNAYAHYSSLSEDGTLEYHQYPIKDRSLLTDSYEKFKIGRRELRNQQDYARKQSYALRDQLREYWKLHQETI